MSCTLPVRWLHQAWCELRAFDLSPHCTISPKSCTVRVFVKRGIGMRTCTCTVSASVNEPITFVVTDAMRNFVARLAGFSSELTLRFNMDKSSVTLELGRVASALQYTFEHILFDEERYIEPTPQDVAVDVPMDDWLSLLTMAPSVGNIKMSISARKRGCVLTHGGGRWTAAIQLREKSPTDKTFESDSETLRRLSLLYNSDATHMTLTLLHCGVMRWSDGRGLEAYVAPVE